MRFEFESLDQVPLEMYYDFSEGPLDPKIVKLVKAINYFGIETKASCQGHLRRGHPFPWVSIWPPIHPDSDPKKLEALRKIDLKHEPDVYRRRFIEQEIKSLEKGIDFYQIIQEYNSNNAVKWRIDGTWLRPTTEARNLQQLISLQQDAEKLAEYIFERSLAKSDMCVRFRQ
ncbi:hypothetical protein B6U82_00495 [Candidatus Pacearchaeota archaeon ex4484_31]|nr:MAG: hypothetical protein B6U82_00495 [Candidatus Pacearchaeota archaeon ex4484_31]